MRGVWMCREVIAAALVGFACGCVFVIALSRWYSRADIRGVARMFDRRRGQK